MSQAPAATVSLTADEAAVLKELMRDVQVAASAFYAKTATIADVDSLGSEVRTFLSVTQTLNERLGGTIADQSTYRALLAGTSDGEFIDAIKYVRNVAQHVLHIVRPSNATGALIGGLHGLRLYVDWDDVPTTADAELRPGTRALRPSFEARLRGKEVVGTMLRVLRAFATVAPQIVHRDERGEWTGFPLKTQPSVSGQLHPEEPEELAQAFSWLDSRVPNGDARVVVGQITVDGEPHLVGYSIAGRLVPNVFVESSQQVDDDIARGFEYITGDIASHVEVLSGFNGETNMRVAHPVSEWATPIERTRSAEDWGVDPADEEWARVMRFAQPGYLPESGRYEIRRGRRLLA